MSNKIKRILIISLVLNVFLLLVLVFGYLKMNLAHTELFFSEVQYKLVELDGLIEIQKKHNWNNPNLVTAQMSDVLNGIDVATNTGKYSGWLSDKDRMKMEKLSSGLRRYPHDELYELSVITESDEKRFEDLQVELQNVGIGMGTQIGSDWKTFISKAEELIAFFQSN